MSSKCNDSQLKINSVRNSNLQSYKNAKLNNIGDRDPDNFEKTMDFKKNNFNILIEQSINIDNYSLSSNFDVRKYLPKDDLYSSKILLKYKNLIENKNSSPYEKNGNHQKNFEIFLNREIPQQQNSISEIQKVNSLLEGESKFDELNFNIISNKNNIKGNDRKNKTEINNIISNNKVNKKEEYLNIDEEFDNSESLPEGCFEIYAEEEEYDENDNNIEEIKVNEDNSKSEIEQLNIQLLQRNKWNLRIPKEYSWYCMDYDCKKQREIIEKFLSCDI